MTSLLSLIPGHTSRRKTAKPEGHATTGRAFGTDLTHKVPSANQLLGDSKKPAAVKRSVVQCQASEEPSQRFERRDIKPEHGSFATAAGPSEPSMMPRQSQSTSLARPSVAAIPRSAAPLPVAVVDDDEDNNEIAELPAKRASIITHSTRQQEPIRRDPFFAARHSSSASSSKAVDDDDAENAPPRRAAAQPTWRDIDAADVDAPQFATEYVQDIYEYLREREISTRVNARYMNSQPELTEAMRKLLVSWMFDVCEEFQLLSETTFLSVRLVDQYLQTRRVARDRLQLLGVAAMLLASKYEEIYHPPVEDFLFVSANSYDRPQLVQMELQILQALNFDLGFPTSLQFLRRFSKAANSDAKLHTCCKYFLELCLPVYGMVAFTPSKIAAAAVFVTRTISKRTPVWDSTLQHYTGYSSSDLTDCVKLLVHTLKEEAAAESLCTASTKYAAKELYQVSTSVLDYFRRRSAASSAEARQR